MLQIKIFHKLYIVKHLELKDLTLQDLPKAVHSPLSESVITLAHRFAS